VFSYALLVYKMYPRDLIQNWSS